jgi:hypothetical protein
MVSERYATPSASGSTLRTVSVPWYPYGWLGVAAEAIRRVRFTAACDFRIGCDMR